MTMPVDTSIYNAFLAPQKSALEYQNEFLGAQAQRQKIQQNAIGLQGAQASLADAQRVRDEQSGIRSALAGLPATSTPDEQVKALRSLGTPTALTTADTLATSYGNQLKSAAGAAKDNADAGKTTQATAIEKHNQRLQALATVQSPEDAVQWALEGVKSGDMPSESLPIVLQKIGAAAQAPGGLDQWKQRLAQAGQSVQQQREQAAPKPTEVKLGNVVKIIDMNGYSPTYGKEVVQAQPVGVSPDAQLQANTSAGNNRANIAKDYAIAGLDGKGNMPAAAPGQASGSPVQGLVDAVGKGQVSQETALARMPPAMKGNFSTLLAQQYPDFDPTAYGAKAHAAKDFTDGPLGNQMRSNATATAHLDQLSQLAAAINNGDVRIVNQIANAYGVQTGQAPVQVFNAVKNIVGQEVVKSIVSGGGGEGERQEAGKSFDSSSSPEQFLQTVGAVKHIMGAQNDNLLAQRRAAGLKDSSLPNYNGGKSAKEATAAPAGFVITHVNGKAQ